MNNNNTIYPAPDKGRYRKFGFKLGNLTHIGHDFDCPEDTPVIAIADGMVVDNKMINGFGSMNPHTNGGVLFIKHIDKNGHYFIGLYGHVKSKLQKGIIVRKGDIIGSIIEFYNSNLYLPHLHFGIYISNEIPQAPYGYTSNIDKWVNPIEFLKTRI
ncbi:MAG: hypothetical protein A2015_02270 [Spirochaetes bacterium GWF1_31_7]|nr:MAG: hypothetical protein A2Y30_06120 [Spirochaetes bacterium GWE1_32_154]OHD50741.1 MAG: hypothetical protein A2015_02270 [Spirochaetes bacterium GWF1_31_7]OHD81465.1 MAG: hypothetical protein A2355_11245 [Spirochaetes bacterium RIFOXYB1_FULL_32_8]HBD95078.1 hypothetical protein [Spirochaetia bacterium]HBI38036.1 hypothetical protein [Spirochaetia bacterium]